MSTTEDLSRLFSGYPVSLINDRDRAMIGRVLADAANLSATATRKRPLSVLSDRQQVVIDGLTGDADERTILKRIYWNPLSDLEYDYAAGVLGGGGNVQTIIINDEFISGDFSSPRTATPGPGVYDIVDASGILSISGGEGVANGTPAAITYWRTQSALAHTPGQMVEFHLTSYTSGRLYPQLNQFAALSLSANFAFERISNARVDARDDGNGIANLISSAISNFAIVQRDGGGVFLIAEDTLQWVSISRATTALYFGVALQNGIATNANFDDFRVSQLGSGGLISEYGIVTNRVAAPANGETTASESDAFTTVLWTPKAAEVLTILFRRVDDDNTMKLVCDQAAGTIKLYERSGGVDTELNAGKTHTWTVSTQYRIVLRYGGTTIVTFVDYGRKHNATSSFNQVQTGVKVSSSDGTPNLNALECWRYALTGFPFP